MANKYQQKKDDFDSKFRINDEIRTYGNVRIVGEGVEPKIVDISEARKMAEEAGLDLVEMQTRSDIPIVRICNYEKMVYEMKKSAKKNKQKAAPLKEVQLRVNIAKHDMETKAKMARRFIEDGSKVKVVLTMKGRETMRREENKKTILDFIVMLDDVAVPEGFPRDEGNRTIVIMKRRIGKVKEEVK